MTPEFSRPVSLERIGDNDAIHDIAANEEERAALVRRFGLLGLGRLEGHVTLRRIKGAADRMLRLQGSLSADVVQACVVTLEPVPSRLEHDFTVLYGAEDEGEDVVVGVGDDEAVEPWPADGTVDLGEAVAQELSLALDPYPRAPGALIDPSWQAEEGVETARTRPFANLDRIRKPKT